ncbi:glycosyltransferase [Dehalobacterium formicoaceticum]|uniref:Glycosyltransferase n=1 Tax=Dehalobacterium formicoaceticum TaxID=51515 RepID=A0ABT1Y2Z6_9FIRM|nr:glycosyltransferase [Dehalobacterium formicoaceticum]MCR6545242.1 glycosyltransferase [Dehalobacterium formicoaceticum]
MAVLVSVICITYNHENYIGDAIEGFIMQQTDFDFEILIGEDCSTDGTRKVIESYANQYPEKIKLITSDQNVGMIENYRRVYAKSSGKYIAECEGDDYWTDPQKLQKQVDFMEAHPECSMCFHAAEVIDVRNNTRVAYIRPFNKTHILPENNFFYGGGPKCPTASVIYVRELMKNPPQFYHEALVGDFAFSLVMLASGRIGYMDEVMSVRNLWVPGSWVTKYNHESTKEDKVHHLQGMIKTLNGFNEFSHGKWEYEVQKKKLEWCTEIRALLGDKHYLKDGEIKKLFNQLVLKDKMEYVLCWYIPGMNNLYENFRRTVKKHLLRVETEHHQALK